MKDPTLTLLTEIVASLLDTGNAAQVEAAAGLRKRPSPRSLLAALAMHWTGAMPEAACHDFRHAARYAYAHIRTAFVKDVAVRHGLILRDSFRALGDAEKADQVQAMIDAVQSRDPVTRN